MKHAFLCIVVAAMAMSCSKSENTPVVEPETIPELKVSVDGSYAYRINAPVKGSADYSFIGYGYDVTGKFADTSSVRVPVFDVAAFVQDQPGRFNPGKLRASYVTPAVIGDAVKMAQFSYLSFARDYNLPLFKHAVTSYFPEPDAFSSKYVYAVYESKLIWDQYKLNAVASHILPYLTAAFLHDVQELAADALVEKYGTHVLTGVYTGQKLKIMYRAQSSATDKEAACKAGFERVLDSVFNIGFAAGASPAKPSDLRSLSDQKVFFEVKGGDVREVSIDYLRAVPLVNVGDWLKSITEANSIFVDIPTYELVKMEELIQDEVKSKAVKDYIASYLKSNEAKIVD